MGTSVASFQWQRTLVRFDRSGLAKGTGFLAPGGHIITCAHVVEAAIGPVKGSAVGREVALAFPFSPWVRDPVAEVVAWHPLVRGLPHPDGPLSDIAVLKLRDPDIAVRPCHVLTTPPARGDGFVSWGFPEAGDPRGASAEGEFGDTDPAGWINATATSAMGHFLEPGFSGAPAFRATPSGVEGGAVIGMCGLADSAKRIGRLIPGQQLVQALRGAINPYPGPAPFSLAHSLYFHGRDYFCDRLFATLGAHRAVILTGVPGDGKTSIVHAGVRVRALDAFGQTILDAFGQTIEVGAEETGPARLAARLTNNRSHDLFGPDVLSAVEERAVMHNGLLLILDDADVILNWPEDLGRRFLARLTRFTYLGASSGFKRVRVLLVSNSREEELLSLLSEDQRESWAIQGVEPFRDEELRAAIIEPAALLGVRFAERLPDRMIRDWRSRTLSLGTLQSSLHDLWRNRRTEFIGEVDYRGFGSPDQVLEQAALGVENLEALAEDSRVNALRATALARHRAGPQDEDSARKAPAAAALPDEIKMVAQRLTVFAGDFDEAGASAVGWTSPPDRAAVRDTLRRLVAAHIARPGTLAGRYELAPDGAAAVLGGLPAEHLTTARIAHLAYFTAMAADCEPQMMQARRASALLRLGLESREFDRALETCAETPVLAHDGLRLAGSLFWYWNFQARFREGRAHLERLLALAGDLEGSAAWAKANYAAGGLSFLMGDLQIANERLSNAVHTWRSLAKAQGHERWKAYALVIRARVQKDFDVAQRLAASAVEIFGRLDDAFGLPLAFNDLGYVLAGEEQKRELAKQYYARAITLWRQADDFWGLALTLINYGALAIEERDFATARRSLEEALKIQREAKDTWGEPNTLKFLGELDFEEGNLLSARERYLRSLELHQRLGRKQLVADCLAGLARIAAAGEASAADCQYAARMLAASNKAIAVDRYPVPESQQRVMKELERKLRDKLGYDMFTKQRTIGRRYSHEAAIAEAAAYYGSRGNGEARVPVEGPAGRA